LSDPFFYAVPAPLIAFHPAGPRVISLYSAAFPPFLFSPQISIRLPI